MNTRRCSALSAVLRPLLVLPLLLFMIPPLAAQDAGGESSLTFTRYPYNFSNDRPLKPDSPVLLYFNASVRPDSVEGGIRLYDKTNERFAAVTATRPTPDQILEFRRNAPEETDLERFVLIRPASPLPLGGTWYLHAAPGLASADGTHEIVEGQLAYLGELMAFEIRDIQASSPYDAERELVIRHNKSALEEGFTPERLAEFITVSPRPEGMKIQPDRYQIRIGGEFEFGIDYRVTVRDGILGNDTTQLAQVVEQKVTFVPNPGFITYPTFSTTQNATGHRKFEIRSGNLTGVRTRVKLLEGKELITALREYRDHYEGWGEKQGLTYEAFPGRTIYDQFRDPAGELDTTETVTLQWDEMAKGVATGAFFLCSEGDSSTRASLSVGAQSLIQLTDLGLVWKQSDEDTVVYGFSLKSGEPLAGLTVRLLDEEAEVVVEALTDESGTLRIAGDHYRNKEARFFLEAALGTDRHVIAFEERLPDVGLWSFGIPQRYDDLLEGERRTLIFTDRNVYRPGDEVKVKSIARFIDPDKLVGPGKGTATFRVFDARHRKLLEREVTYGDTGSFDEAFTLPAEGMGWHSIEVDCNPTLVDGEHPDWRLISNHSFQVEDYRVNTFEVKIADAEAPGDGGALSLPIQANYYMGKPLSKAALTWMVYARNEFPRPRGFDEFQFGNRSVDEETFRTEGTASLTSRGEATAAFSLPEQTLHPGPREVSLVASVTDANQQTISASKSFTVDSSDFYLGLRLPEGVHRTGDTATFSLAAVNTRGEAHTAPVEVGVLVEKEEWTTVKVMGANGKMVHRNDKRLRTLSDTPVVLRTQVDPATGLTRAMPHQITFPEAGDFQITLTARDEKGRHILTRTPFRVIGAEEPAWSWHDVIRIDLIPDKTTYQIGDTAKLLVRTPVFGHALLTVERGGVRSTRSLRIDQYETILEVPVEDGAAPNLFASLLLIRGSDESPHVHPSADYRLGYCELEVEDPAVTLHTSIDTGAADYYQPGEEIELTATVLDHQNRPVAGAEVTFFAVDEGVLSLTGHPTPDPGAVFHEAFPLAVRTGQSLGDLVPENPLEQDFSNKGYVIGGGGVFGIDPERMRKDFKALAFWEPSLATDANGVVRATVIAPDNLTTFRVMAVVAEGDRFGKAEAPLLINKPLIIEPALPGFTNLTDQIDIAAVLHNNSKETQEVEVAVSLDAHGIFLAAIGEVVPTNLTDAAPGSGEKVVKLALSPGATETVSFPIALTKTGEAKWSWKVRSLTDERLRDGVESVLQVGYPLPLLRETHTFRLKDGADLSNALEKITPRLLDGYGNIELTLSNSRLVEAAEGIDFLLTYPYGCVEQTTSSLIPWLSTQQLRPVMPKLEKSAEETNAIIQKGVMRLFSMQTDDGGLGYWPGAGESILWGSAYGSVAITMAERQGIEVPEVQALALRDYLSLALRNTAELKSPYEISQRCLTVYALALAGVAETSYHEVLYEKRKDLSAEARSLLVLAMLESGNGSPERIHELLSHDAKVPVAQVSWYKQPYIAATRLLAEIHRDPASDEIEGLVDELMKLREPQNGWGSTYSNAWPLIALAAYGENAVASLAGNQVDVAFAGETRRVEFPAEPGGEVLSFDFEGHDPNRALSIKTGGEAPVYASLQIATRPALMPVEAENNGFGITRSYRKVESDGTIVPAGDLRVGDLILVTLDMNIPNERETYLAIDDPLPAIFEAVNPTFKTQETQRINANFEARTLFTSYREIRKDRVLFFADSVFSAGDYRLQYLARVVAPGQVTAPPAKIEAMYEPRRFGLSGTERISAAARVLEPGKVAGN